MSASKIVVPGFAFKAVAWAVAKKSLTQVAREGDKRQKNDVRRVTSHGSGCAYGGGVELTEGHMFRTVSIATLMAPLAHGASFAGYSAPDMAEIFTRPGSSPVDDELGPPDTHYQRDCSQVQFAY